MRREDEGAGGRNVQVGGLNSLWVIRRSQFRQASAGSKNLRTRC
jgi:hypothetical protein